MEIVGIAQKDRKQKVKGIVWIAKYNSNKNIRDRRDRTRTGFQLWQEF